MGADLVGRVIDELATGTARPIEQDRSQASKAPRLKKEDGVIDWSRSAQDIKNQVRALRPWPRAVTFWHREIGEPLRLNVDRVAVAASVDMPKILPGTVLAGTDRLIVAAGDGALEILELQPSGRRSMPASEFLRGNRVGVNDRFGPQ
jgi:methionyl-tRNA formyltransferase